MTDRIIIKPYRIAEISGGNIETGGASIGWYARPDFVLPNGKKYFGRGLSPWMAVIECAKYMPREYREMICKLNADHIYTMPDCDNFEWKVIDLDGYVPTREDWLLERQYFNRHGSLDHFAYWKFERDIQKQIEQEQNGDAAVQRA